MCFRDEWLIFFSGISTLWNIVEDCVVVFVFVDLDRSRICERDRVFLFTGYCSIDTTVSPLTNSV